MKRTEMLVGDRFFLRGNEYEVLMEATFSAPPVARRISDGAMLTVEVELEPLLESYRRGDIPLGKLIVDLRHYALDEGVAATKAKFDKWIPVLEELTELRVKGAGEVLKTVRSAYDAVARAFDLIEEYSYDRTEISPEEWETIVNSGDYEIVGRSEGGYSMDCKHTPDLVYWDDGSKKAYRLHRREG